MSPKSRVEIAEQLAEAWNLLGIRYAIVHGIEDFPEKIGRDLDILVHVDDSSEILAATHQILEQEGWIAVDPPDVWGSRIVAFSAHDGLEVHTVTELSWREIDLASTPRPARHGDMFPLDPWASFAKQVLMPGFHGDFRKMSSNALALRLTESDRELVRQALFGLVSPEDEPFAVSLLDKSPEDLESLLPTLRSLMVKRSWRRRPLSAIASLVRKINQRLDGLLRPTGVTVQLVADENIDRDRVVQWIKSSNRSVFTDFVFRMPGSRWPQSTLGLLSDAMRRLWLRLVADRAPLSGQRVVFHLARAASYEAGSGGAIRRLSRWLDRLGSQAQAVVVIGRSSTLIRESESITVSGQDPGATGTAIVGVAIEAFIRRHSQAK